MPTFQLFRVKENIVIDLNLWRFYLNRIIAFKSADSCVFRLFLIERILAGQIRILTGDDHSGIQVDFFCSEFIPGDVHGFDKVME
jgi:hypothetical protein